MENRVENVGTVKIGTPRAAGTDVTKWLRTNVPFIFEPPTPRVSVNGITGRIVIYSAACLLMLSKLCGKNIDHLALMAGNGPDIYTLYIVPQYAGMPKLYHKPSARPLPAARRGYRRGNNIIISDISLIGQLWLTGTPTQIFDATWDGYALNVDCSSGVA
jgi:hypothetical protein